MLTSITLDGSSAPRFFAVETYLGVLCAIIFPSIAFDGNTAPLIATSITTDNHSRLRTVFAALFLLFITSSGELCEIQTVKPARLRHASPFRFKFLMQDFG